VGPSTHVLKSIGGISSAKAEAGLSGQQGIRKISARVAIIAVPTMVATHDSASYIGSSGSLNFELVGTGVGMGYESAAKLGDARCISSIRGQGGTPTLRATSRSSGSRSDR